MKKDDIDYKELYFKLYSDVAEVIERLQEIELKYEDLYCRANENEIK